MSRAGVVQCDPELGRITSVESLRKVTQKSTQTFYSFPLLGAVPVIPYNKLKMTVFQRSEM